MSSDILDHLGDLDYMPDPPIGTIMSDVVPERVTWLWSARVPFGKLTVLDGDPGLGKSTLSLELAARVSRGLPLPGDETAAYGPSGVVLLSAEDDLADTIRPRLDAAGADVTRVLALRTVPNGEDDLPPSIPDDLDYIHAAIRRVDAKLLIVDPLMAFLNGTVDAHKDQQVRRALHRLSNLAEDTGVAIIVVRHLNKASGGNPLYRGGGSIGIVGAARSGLLVARDPDDEHRRVIASTKCNLAAEPPSIAFHLEQHDDASRIVWDGVSDHGAAALLATPIDADERTARDDARVFLMSVLGNGPMPAREVERLATEAGVSKRTLHRAKSEAKVRSIKGYSGWTWELPEGATSQSMATLATLATLEETAGQSTTQECHPSGEDANNAKDATLPRVGEVAAFTDWDAVRDVAHNMKYKASRTPEAALIRAARGIHNMGTAIGGLGMDGITVDPVEAEQIRDGLTSLIQFASDAGVSLEAAEAVTTDE